MGKTNYNPYDFKMNEIKHKEQRLQLLLHGSGCQYEEGSCPEVAYCSIMKKLWKHIIVCNDNKCSTQHCIESKYLLSQYRNGANAINQYCLPINEDKKEKVKYFHSCNSGNQRQRKKSKEEESQPSCTKRMKHNMF